jgi:RHS repeat-associated protein
MPRDVRAGSLTAVVRLKRLCDGSSFCSALRSRCSDRSFGTVGQWPMAKANPFRFSTKYQDDETDLIYFGYRHYNASTGRWTSRDPIEEKGGLNIYAMLGNNAVNDYDLGGLIGPHYPGEPGEPYNPPHLGQRCSCACARRPCQITAEPSDAGSDEEAFRIRLNMSRSGCCRDLQILWTTCRRTGGYGILDSCTDATDCTFKHNTPPATYGAWELGIFIRALTCTDGVWKPIPQIPFGLYCHEVYVPVFHNKWICNQ